MCQQVRKYEIIVCGKDTGFIWSDLKIYSIIITQTCVTLNELPNFSILQGLICKTDYSNQCH